ncbi:unnamed protein product [Effrenium voratum]|nr:unnamed protein product [Effrenium voratum]
MGQASLATFYVVFAILTIYLNLESIGTWNANAVFRTISSALSGIPFETSQNDTRHLSEVQDPEQVYFWLKSSFKPAVFGEQESMSIRAGWGNLSHWSYNMTPATIGSFNRILLTRFTFKRWAVEPVVGQFQSTTPRRLAGSSMKLDPFSVNTAEDKATLCLPGTNMSSANLTEECFQWAELSSFDNCGGYTSFFDPMDGSSAYDALLEKMYQTGVFDLRLGTFTVDFIVYNANVEMFMQYVQIFTFDFSGGIQMQQIARSFNLNVFNTSESKYMMFYVIRVTCVVMLVIFLLIEFRRMWDLGFFAHFRRQGAVTDMVSITISLGVFLSYWVIEQMPPFKSFQFQDLVDVNTRAATYVSLCDVARTLQDQGLLIAFNLLVVSLRTVSLVSGLHSNLGLILKVIGVSLPNFAAFITLFCMLQMGFVLMSYFAFGSGYAGMNTLGLCIYRSFSMLNGQVVFNEIVRVDEILGVIYFFSFYVLFYLVLINIFVTLLMSGYDVVDYELQKKNQNEQEKNPIVLIFEELKADVVGNILKYGTTVIKYVRICLDPIVVSIKACCFCSLPSIPTNFRGAKRQATLNDIQVEQDTSEDPDPSGQFRHNLVEFSSMIVFMAVWILLMTLQGRGMDCFFISQATLRENALQVMFKEQSDTKTFDSIQTFEDVKLWADAAIVGLYDDPVCAEATGGSSTAWSEGSCSNSNNSQQLVNRVADWNIGFLNTTFVRVSIQPACFVKTSSQWSAGSPTLRKTPNVECWSSVCTDVFTSEPCRTADGDELNVQMLSSAINMTSTLPDTFSFGYQSPGQDLGPYRMLGGLAFSLGVTIEECQEMLLLLAADRWFTENSASMVFDWMSYNGNMDLFTHNVVAFSLMETGVMTKTALSQTFPMNIDSGGGYFELQTLVMVLFGLYVVLLLYHIVEMIKIVCMKVKKSRSQKKTAWRFMVDFFSESWNVVDSMSLLISLATFVSFLIFVLDSFRTTYRFSMDDTAKYPVPNDDVKLYEMQQAVNPVRNLEDDWYFFKEFEKIQGMYFFFLQLAAVNSVFIAVKTIKIVNRFRMLKKFSDTLANGKSRNLYFIIVIKLQMSGFALAMTVLFGTMVEDFSAPINTMGSLLFWLCGSSELEPLLKVHPALAVVFFVAFLVIFRFISTNMFLATQLNTFAELVGRSDIAEAKKEAAAKLGAKQVRFPSKNELEANLELERQAENQVVVKRILGSGAAVKANVKVGDVVSKVNKQKIDWATYLPDEDDDEHVERALEPEADGSVTLMFQDPPNRGLLAKFTQACCSCGQRQKVKPGRKHQQQAYAKHPFMRPTVRNFWRSHGAIARVEKESEMVEHHSDEEPVSGSDDEQAEGEERIVEEHMQDGARARARAKRRIDGFLFSRWPEANKPKEMGAAGINLEELGRDDSELLEEDIIQEGWDVDELTDIIEEMPITGQEVWLDCLLVALEEEVIEESPIIEVLKTNGLQEMSKAKLKGPARERLLKFYRRLDQVLRILENKAYRRYFQNLQLESEQRQQLLLQQNEVLHDYVCELEKEFSDISETIHNYKTKKELMLKKLAGLLDRSEYSKLDSRRSRN